MSDQRSQLEDTFLRRLQPKTTPTTAAPLGGELSGRRRDASLFSLAIDRIRPDPDQVRRFNKAATDPSMQELAASIRSVGLLQPIDVRYDRDNNLYQIVAGERRYTAAKLAGLQELSVKLLDTPAHEVRRLQILENIQREQLSPLELGSALLQLVEAGSTTDDLARLLCKTTSYIAKALGIARNLSADAEQVIRQNPDRFQSMTHLYEVSLLPRDEQQAVLSQMGRQNLTRAQLQSVTTEIKHSVATPRSKRGRPRKIETSTTKVITLDDATVTIRVHKAHATMSDYIAVLREALQTLT